MVDTMETQILSLSDYQRACGLRLRRVIDQLGMSYVDAAELMGVTKHVLRNWMAGDHPVQVYPLYRLCRARGINFDYVFLGDWSSLPHSLGQAFEAELRSAPASPAAPAQKDVADAV